MKTYLMTLMILGSLVFPARGQGTDAGFTEGEGQVSFEQMLSTWAGSFIEKVPQGYADTLNFFLQDTGESWYIPISGGSYQVIRGENPKARIVVTGSYQTYHKLYTGQLNGMTAVARASIRNPAPLDFILKNDMSIRDLDMNDLYFKASNFFNAHPHNKVILGRDHARKVHGGYAVGLYYSIGYRSAYYTIRRGETINESGEKDPWQQSFIIISGQGYAQLGQDTIPLKANEAYYIKPNIYHKVWTDSEEGVSLIWNAWGKEAW